MSLRAQLHRVLSLEQMMHCRPLTKRFWGYAAAAYLMPVVVQLAFPADPGLYDELVWLITLAPAFLLSLHYGLNGAVLGLLMGTVLFVAVQLSLALNFTADDWRITVPIFIAYGTLSISVGWLSQELHDHYRKRLETERLAGVDQVAVTIRHELNNALQQLLAESQFLDQARDGLTPEQCQSLDSIIDGAKRMAADLRKLTNLSSAPTTDYPGGSSMLDLRRAEERST